MQPQLTAEAFAKLLDLNRQKRSWRAAEKKEAKGIEEALERKRAKRETVAALPEVAMGTMPIVVALEQQ